MSSDITIQAERCYWVRLPPSGRRWSRDRVLAGIEPWIACTVEGLDLAWATGSDGQVLVAASEPEVIDALIAAEPHTASLTPDRIPEHVQVSGVVATDLQFLTGQRTPPSQRRLSRMLLVIAGAVTAAFLLTLAIGTYRKWQQLETHRQQAVGTLAAAINNAIPPALGGRDPNPTIRLDQAQRLSTSLSRAVDSAEGGAAAIFAIVLAAWPADLRLQTQSISVDGNRLVISGTASSVDDAQTVANALATAITGSTGWRVSPLRANNTGHNVSFTCSATREGRGK